MTIERQRNGSFLITDIKNGVLLRRVYYGYSKTEAVRLFREFIKGV